MSLSVKADFNNKHWDNGARRLAAADKGVVFYSSSKVA